MTSISTTFPRRQFIGARLRARATALLLHLLMLLNRHEHDLPPEFFRFPPF